MNKLYVDAGTLRNGYPSQVSRICVHDGVQVIYQACIGNKTNNEAELLAIKKAIELLPDGGEIYSDSQLSVRLLTGKYKARKPHLKALIQTFSLPTTIQLNWISRDHNPAGWYLEQVYHI